MAIETYLGDGLYVSFDGFAFILRAPRENGDHYVILELSMIDGLNEFVKTVINFPRASADGATG